MKSQNFWMTGAGFIAIAVSSLIVLDGHILTSPPPLTAASITGAMDAVQVPSVASLDTPAYTASSGDPWRDVPCPVDALARISLRIPRGVTLGSGASLGSLSGASLDSLSGSSLGGLGRVAGLGGVSLAELAGFQTSQSSRASLALWMNCWDVSGLQAPDPPPISDIPSSEQAITQLGLSARLALDHSLVARDDGDAIALLDLSSISQAGGRDAIAVAIVFDTSASMMGPKISNAREAAHRLIDRLEPTDVLSIVTFHNASDVVISNLQLSSEAARQEAHDAVERMRVRGQTCMECGLDSAYDLFEGLRAGIARHVIVLSDGAANRGRTTAAELSALASDARGADGITTTSIGLGNGYDADLLEILATAGGANYYFVHDSTALTDVLDREVASLSETAFRNLEVDIRAIGGAQLGDLQIPNGYPTTTGYHFSVEQLSLGESRNFLLPLRLPAGELSEVVRVEVSFTSVSDPNALGLVSLGGVLTRSDDDDAIKRSVNFGVTEASEQMASMRTIRIALDHLRAGQSGRAIDMLQDNAARLNHLVEEDDGASERLRHEADQAALVLEQVESGDIVPASPEAEALWRLNQARLAEGQHGYLDTYHQNGMYDLTVVE